MLFWSQHKIYLAIESVNELAVQKAKTEITRLIKEELIRLVSINHTDGCHADIKIKRSPFESLSDARYVEQVCVQQISMKDVTNSLFPSFFFLAKFVSADEQRPVQSIVEEEARLSGGVSISHQSPVISTVASKWLKNILVYIF